MFLRQPGDVVVDRSIEIGHPIVYVAMNYRLSGLLFTRYYAPPAHALTSAYGFLGGKEVKEAGVANLGLLDRESYCVSCSPAPFDNRHRT